MANGKKIAAWTLFGTFGALVAISIVAPADKPDSATKPATTQASNDRKRAVSEAIRAETATLDSFPAFTVTRATADAVDVTLDVYPDADAVEPALAVCGWLLTQAGGSNFADHGAVTVYGRGGAYLAWAHRGLACELSTSMRKYG